MSNKIKPKAPTKTEKPEDVITLDGLLGNAIQSEENIKSAFFKQQGVKEFLESLKKEGYELVKEEK